MNQVKISIIVPVYNSEIYLNRCIDSILGQSFDDYELILIDDGSKDRSGVICDEYASKNEKIKVVHKENGGQSSARNIGLDIAVGNYIGFADSDDWIEKNMYMKLYNNAIKYEAEISACNFLRVEDGIRTKQFNNKDEQILTFSRDEALKELPYNKMITYSPCNKIYIKEIFADMRFEEDIIYEDMDISYKLIFKSKKLVYDNSCLYYYFINSNSTLGCDFSLKRVDEYFVKKNMYDFYLKHYPQYSLKVYLELFFTGIKLYLYISQYYTSDKNKYRYLILFDKNILKCANAENDYLYRKIAVRFFLISPKAFLGICKYLIK